MRKKITVVVCDLCGKEVPEEDSREGVIHLDSQQSKKFDICNEDIEKHFGEIKASPRRGRKPEQEPAAA